jgi:hypothetical protein
VIACTDPKEPGVEYTFTEKDFASVLLEKAEKERNLEGVITPGGVLYGASKTAAEREVWRFRDEVKVCLLSFHQGNKLTMI